MSLFVICVETIIYLLLYNLHDCTFKDSTLGSKGNVSYFIPKSLFLRYSYIEISKHETRNTFY